MRYQTINLMAEADPNNENRIGFNDPIKHPMTNFHPTTFAVYDTESGRIAAYIPDYYTNNEIIANFIANSLSLNEVSLPLEV